jgi:phage baseplate assembly protein W
MTTYIGMDKHTGKRITDAAHIHQSCTDILTTRIGTRTKRRNYGSILPDLIDHPNNPVNRVRVMAATVLALTRWEPRIVITQVDYGFDLSGETVINIDSSRVDASGSELYTLPLSIKVS